MLLEAMPACTSIKMCLYIVLKVYISMHQPHTPVTKAVSFKYPRFKIQFVRIKNIPVGALSKIK